jgi:hypothetical protein
MFRSSQRPSSEVPKTVSATSGIGHRIGTATFFHRGLIRTGVGEFCGMYSTKLVLFINIASVALDINHVIKKTYMKMIISCYMSTHSVHMYIKIYMI